MLALSMLLSILLLLSLSASGGQNGSGGDYRLVYDHHIYIRRAHTPNDKESWKRQRSRKRCAIDDEWKDEEFEDSADDEEEEQKEEDVDDDEDGEGCL